MSLEKRDASITIGVTLASSPFSDYLKEQKCTLRIYFLNIINRGEKKNSLISLQKYFHISLSLRNRTYWDWKLIGIYGIYVFMTAQEFIYYFLRGERERERETGFFCHRHLLKRPMTLSGRINEIEYISGFTI